MLYENRQAIADTFSSVGNYLFGTTPTAPTTEQAKPVTESTDVKIVDWSTMEANAQTVSAKMPASLDAQSSKRMRDDILMEYGFSKEDVAAYNTRFPKAGLGEKEAGFFIGNNDGTKWATKEEMATWGVNENGYTNINMSAETVAGSACFGASAPLGRAPTDANVHKRANEPERGRNSADIL